MTEKGSVLIKIPVFCFHRYLTFFSNVAKIKNIRGRSEAGLSCWPVKPETAGSSPVAPVLTN